MALVPGTRRCHVAGGAFVICRAVSANRPVSLALVNHRQQLDGKSTKYADMIPESLKDETRLRAPTRTSLNISMMVFALFVQLKQFKAGTGSIKIQGIGIKANGTQSARSNKRSAFSARQRHLWR